MIDEEIRKYAREFIIKACKNVKPTFDKNELKISLTLNHQGIYEFTLDLAGLNEGPASVVFSPQPTIERHLKLTLEGMKNLRERGELDCPVETEKELVNRYFEFFAQISILTMITEFFGTVEQFQYLIPTLAHTLDPDEIIRNNRSKTLENVAVIMEHLNQMRSGRVFDLSERILEQIFPPKYLFSDMYEERLEYWKKAKQFFKKNKDSKNVIDFVKLEFPGLDEELIEQLSDIDSYSSMPSTLALIETARIMQLPKSKSAIRTLKAYLKESRELKKQYSEEQILSARNKFVEFMTDLANRNSRFNAARKEMSHNIQISK